ncbi:Uncharacterized protein SCG7086_AS_00070 [Chlamydiales bacterium SCGC AG-110-P3]|nr:Uncharacterized protein SCG7086_AS_00070 [Chlamydiales bacterium SCGC AG-110-P3]
MLDSAIGVVFDSDGKILLVKRQDIPVWVLPGGGIDEDEDPADAAVREVWEETGLQVKVIRKIARYTPINRLSRNTHIFECGVIGGEIACSDETTDVGYYREDTVPGYLFDLHKYWIHDARQNLPTVIEAPIAGTSYRNAIGFFFLHPLISLQYICSVKFWRGFLGSIKTSGSTRK